MLKKIGLIILLVTCGIGGALYRILLGDPLGGKTQFKGPNYFEDIEIYQGDNGFKIVNAQTYEGSIYGLGVVHGRDRLWQLHFFKFLSQGRVSELGGKDTLDVDLFIRNIGGPRIAKKLNATLGQEDRDILDAYARGINDYVANLKVFPIEFYIMWTRWEPWTAYDSLCVHVMLQYFISFDWFLELTRQKLTEIYDKDLVDQMLSFDQNTYYFNDTELINDEESKRMGFYDENAKILDIDLDLLYYRTNDQPKKKSLHFDQENWHKEEFVGTMGGIGSNCWVVSGQHTKSGKPLFACDPHLNKQMQSMWYMISLRWGDKYVVGGSTVGLPIFSYGRSKDIAWGATALNPDNSDLYVEKVEGDKYFFDGQWYPFRVETEVIKVRLGEDVILENKFTHNGVMLVKPEKDELGFSVWFPLEFLNQNSANYSLRWVYDEGVPTTVFSLKKKMLNRDTFKVEDSNEYFEKSTMFPLNIVFATKDGHIGYHMNGLFPKRKYQVHFGVYPKKGWLKENQWDGFLSAAEHPRVLDPKEGIIVSANNLITSNRAQNGVSHAFSFQHRFLRIREMLREAIATKTKIDVQDMKDAQLDTLDIQARESVRYMVPVIEKGLQSALAVSIADPVERKRVESQIQKSLNHLLNWDFKFELDQIPASIFNALEFNLMSYLEETKIDNIDVRRGIHGNVLFENFVFLEIRKWFSEENPKAEYCDLLVYRDQNKENNCHELLAFAMIKAIEDLEEKMGKDINNWQLENLQFIVYDHTPFSRSPFRAFFEEKRTIKGNRRTPCVALYFYHKDPYSPKFGPIIRMIADLGDEDKIVGAMDTGAEQRPMSPNRVDFMEMFHNGEFMDMPTRSVPPDTDPIIKFTKTSKRDKEDL